MAVPVINLTVSGVETEVWPHGGLSRGDLRVGDLLGGADIAPHGGDLGEVAEITTQGVWLVSVAERLATPLSPAGIRTHGRYFTWRGLGTMRLTRLRLADEVRRFSPRAAATEWFLTPRGEMLEVRGGMWFLTAADAQVGRWERSVLVPIGAEVYKLAASLP